MLTVADVMHPVRPALGHKHWIVLLVSKVQIFTVFSLFLFQRCKYLLSSVFTVKHCAIHVSQDISWTKIVPV